MKKKWKPKFYVHRHPDDPPFRRVKIKESLTKKKHQKDITDNGPLMLMIAAIVIVALAYLRSKGFFG